jgi:hypothetical protein
MFVFPGPPSPEHTDKPCPTCGGELALPVYATAHTQYWRCINCAATWSLTIGQVENAATPKS